MKQVLILGAGASIPYGFPSGASLTRTLYSTYRQNLIDSNAGNPLLVEVEAAFFQSLRMSKVASIDSFTARQALTNPGAKAIASRGICSIISNCENMQMDEPVDRFSPGQPKDWFELFWNRLLAKAKTLDELKLVCSDLTVITFNYDRCFEFLFNRAMCHTFPGSPSMNPATMELPVEVIHVYGDLGTFADKPYPHAFPITENYQGRIKLIGERVGMATTSNLKKKIQDAQRVFFLGFSYDADNLVVMGFPTTNIYNDSGNAFASKEIYGTTMGLAPGEISRIIPQVYLDTNWRSLAENMGDANYLRPVDSRDILQDKFFIE